MSKKHILPLADPSAISLSYLHEMRVRGQGIYMTVAFGLLLALALLPVVKVDVSVRGGGLMQAAIEKSDVLLPVTGRVTYWHMHDNMRVAKGDTLLRIDASGGQRQDELTNARIAELERLLDDARAISAAAMSPTHTPKPMSQQYAAAWEQYRQQLHNTQLRMQQAQREHGRYEALFARKVISVAEYEQYKSKYEQAKAEHDYVSRQYRSQWETDATRYRAELNELYRRRAEWQNQETFYTLVAPISGTIQNLVGIQEGAPVFANQKIAELSPDSSLIAMVYVTPGDIGLIKPGQGVRLQIDAFNYNQWGMLTAKVHEIADDIVLDANSQPVFRVRCILDASHLRLPNGYTGHLKKGMTFQARFLVARRSLFQLLYDKVDDWINPNTA